jgi:RNA polymerase primary sigma factor
VLPSEEVTSEQIEDTMSMLSDMGINVVESDEQEEAEPEPQEEEPEEEPEGRELMEPTGTAVAKKGGKREPTDRTDDPVRMYLREMGSVELLSRQGRVPSPSASGPPRGDHRGLRSPLTFRHHHLARRAEPRRTCSADIIDLEATYAGPTPSRRARHSVRCRPLPEAVAVPAAPPPRAARRRDEEMPIQPRRIDDDEFRERPVALAMEAGDGEGAETFDRVADNYKLRKLQDALVAEAVHSRRSAAQESATEAHRRDRRREEPVAQPGAHRFAGGAALRHQQAAHLLRRQLIRLAEAGVDRSEFLALSRLGSTRTAAPRRAPHLARLRTSADAGRTHRAAALRHP